MARSYWTAGARGRGSEPGLSSNRRKGRDADPNSAAVAQASSSDCRGPVSWVDQSRCLDLGLTCPQVAEPFLQLVDLSLKFGR